MDKFQIGALSSLNGNCKGTLKCALQNAQVGSRKSADRSALSSLHRARRHCPIPRALEPEEEEIIEEVVEEVVDPQDLISKNPAFAAVFKTALQRRGPGALTKGPPATETKYVPQFKLLSVVKP